jgi:TM2 domain-containing membrane protein YozV
MAYSYAVLILGSFGAHHFYLGRNGWGILYLLFCWTGIPTLLGFIECFFMPARVRRFNAEHPQVFATTGATAIGRGVNGPIETAWKDLKSSKSICGAVPIGT